MPTPHVPCSLEAETDLDDALRSWLAFGAEKVAEVVTLSRGLRDGRDAVAAEIAASNAAIASRRSDPRLSNDRIRDRIADHRDWARSVALAEDRRAA